MYNDNNNKIGNINIINDKNIENLTFILPFYNSITLINLTSTSLNSLENINQFNNLIIN